MKKKIGILLFSIIAIALIVGFAVNAKNETNETTEDIGYYKYYTQYYIEHGDTLYEIAGKFMDEYPCIEEVYSLKEYTNLIIEINDLSTTRIIAGQHLVVPYLSEEFK